MLKFFFWCLLLANGALFAFHQGYFGTSVSESREPERLAHQFNVDKIKLLIPVGVPKTASTPIPEALAATDKKQDLLACTEIGNFNQTEAQQFEERLAALSLGAHLSRRNVVEIANYMVYIPSQGSQWNADKKVRELRRLGIQDSSIIQDETDDLQWAISLGVFKTEKRAQAAVAELDQKGVHGMLIAPHSGTSVKIAFRVRELAPNVKDTVDKITADFPWQEMHGCGAA